MQQNEGNVDYASTNAERQIGRWIIRETLGKGGFSWVKKGIDVKTNKVYALKFMERRKNKDGVKKPKIFEFNLSDFTL